MSKAADWIEGALHSEGLASTRIGPSPEKANVVATLGDGAAQRPLIVAHRLSTIRNVDRIYFLEDGVIAEQGSHAELIEARGRYHDLFMRQFGSGAIEAAVVRERSVFGG